MPNQSVMLVDQFGADKVTYTGSNDCYTNARDANCNANIMSKF